MTCQNKHVLITKAYKPKILWVKYSLHTLLPPSQNIKKKGQHPHADMLIKQIRVPNLWSWISYHSFYLDMLNNNMSLFNLISNH